MAVLEWDLEGQRIYENGVDRGVLYLYDKNTKSYTNGVAWNGLTTVTESPSGAEPSPQYADNQKYLNLMSAEEFGGTIEAFTYPDAWSACDGSFAHSKGDLPTGLVVSQQTRQTFGLCFRTRVGNDIESDLYGYKLHLIWGALAQPSERAYATVNDSPEAMTFSWQFSTTPVTMPAELNLKPTSHMILDTTKVDISNQALIKLLEDELYGTDATTATLPMPYEVIQMFNEKKTLAQLKTPVVSGVSN